MLSLCSFYQYPFHFIFFNISILQCLSFSSRHLLDFGTRNITPFSRIFHAMFAAISADNLTCNSLNSRGTYKHLIIYSLFRYMKSIVHLLHRLYLNTILVHGFCLDFNIFSYSSFTPVFHIRGSLSGCHLTILRWIHINYNHSGFERYLHMFKKYSSVQLISPWGYHPQESQSGTFRTRPKSFS